MRKLLVRKIQGRVIMISTSDFQRSQEKEVLSQFCLPTHFVAIVKILNLLKVNDYFSFVFPDVYLDLSIYL